MDCLAMDHLTVMTKGRHFAVLRSAMASENRLQTLNICRL